MAQTRRQAAVNIEHYLFDPENEDLPVFTVLEFSGHESISQLTHFNIKLLADEQDINPADILNKRASLRIWCWQDNGHTRVYHGIISSFQQTGQDEDTNQTFYQVHMVPLLWRLTLNYQSRIFQEKSVPDIIEEVLADAGFQQGDYRLSLNSTYLPLTEPPREFCVQYRETDFNFISRLMEEEGIFYFFDYSGNKEEMVISDHAGIHTETSPMSEVSCEEPTGIQSLEAEYIDSMQYRVNVVPTNFMLTDFNYNTPQTQLSSPMTLVPGTQVGGFLQNDYPGHFGFTDLGGALVAIRSQEADSGRRIISGKSNCRSFCAGYLFTLEDHPNENLTDEDYLLTRISHHGVQPGTMATDVQISYENQFKAIPAPASDFPYRPSRITPRARVQGTQTAIVVGPQGEEIYVDEKGRVKIQFHWDLAGGMDENSSCWIRVSQLWAGSSWGAMFIPRIGQEVIVDFIEGDPDQPIIIGRVYNGANPVPYSLPNDKTKSTVKSDSSPGGGGSNEIRFEDSKGSEEVYIHAQKDMNEKIENNMSTSVGANQSISVGGNRSVTVQKDETFTIEGNETVSITKNRIETVKGNEDITIEGNRTEKVDGEENITIGKGRTETISKGGETVNITGDTMHIVTGNLSIVSTGDMGIGTTDGKIDIGGNAGVNITGPKVATEAKSEITLNSPKVAIEGKSEITLKVGDSSIKIDSSAITITAPTIKNNC